MSRRTPSHRIAVSAALVVTVLWSSSWVLIRWGLDREQLEPLTFAALRYGLAALVLAVWVVSRRRLRAGLSTIDRRSLLWIGALGVVFYAVTQGAQFVAIDHQPAATTSLVLSWTPLVVALVGGWSISEFSSGRQLLGAVVVVAGASLYFAGDLGATFVGMVAALIGLIANVVSGLLGRHVNREATLAPVVITALSMGAGSLLLLSVGLATEGVPTVSLRAGGIIAWLAVVNTAVAFTLWNFSLRSLSALESAAINNTMLIQIALLGWIFLGEPLGVRETGGIGLASLGILLTQAAGPVARPRRSS